MPSIPAICNNIECGAIFQSGFAIEGGGTASMADCLSGPCPSCGSMGRIPNGEYSSISNRISAKLLNISDVQILKRIKKTVEEVIRYGSTDEITEKLEKHEPTWSEIWSLIPENKSDAFGILQLILSFITTGIAIYSLSSKQPESSTIINQSFHHYYQTAPLLKNHNENKTFQMKPLAISIKQNLT